VTISEPLSEACPSWLKPLVTPLLSGYTHQLPEKSTVQKDICTKSHRCQGREGIRQVRTFFGQEGLYFLRFIFLHYFFTLVILFLS